MSHPTRSLLALAVSALLLGACSGSEPTVPEEVSDTSPLMIVSPQNGEAIDQGASLYFRSSSTGAEGRGVAWKSDRDGAIGTGSSFHNESLSFGPHVITATRRSGETATVRIFIASKVLSIVSPADGATFTHEQTVAFAASISDASAKDMVWTSDRDGVLDTGHRAFHLENLSVGQHVLTAARSTGESVTAKITVLPSLRRTGSVVVDFSTCGVAKRPVWFAYQDGAGAWTQVLDPGGIYQFNVGSEKGGYAYRSGDGFLYVRLATRAELTGAPANQCAVAGTKQVSGTLAGTGVSGFVQVGMGEGLGTGSEPTPLNFTLTGVPEGKQDLIAYHRDPSGLGADRAIVRRDVDAPDRGTIGTLDFDGPEAFVAAHATLTVNDPSPVAFAVGYLAGVACSSYYLGAGTTYDPPRAGQGFTMGGIPSERQRASDFHQAWVSTSNTTSSREVLESFHQLADRTVRLPAALPTPMISALPGGHARIRATLTLPSEYQESVWLWYGVSNGVVLGINASFGWLGGPYVALAVPDFSGTGGWSSSYLPPAGGRVHWDFTATGRNLAAAGGACAENARSYIAHVNGSSPS
jgi:hypothetical protein